MSVNTSVKLDSATQPSQAIQELHSRLQTLKTSLDRETQKTGFVLDLDTVKSLKIIRDQLHILNRLILAENKSKGVSKEDIVEIDYESSLDLVVKVLSLQERIKLLRSSSEKADTVLQKAKSTSFGALKGALALSAPISQHRQEAIALPGSSASNKDQNKENNNSVLDNNNLDIPDTCTEVTAFILQATANKNSGTLSNSDQTAEFAGIDDDIEYNPFKP